MIDDSVFASLSNSYQSFLLNLPLQNHWNNYNKQNESLTQLLIVSSKGMFMNNYSQSRLAIYYPVLNRRDSPLINYSIFLPPSPTLFSTPHLLILENFTSLPFYSRLPIYYFMCTVNSGSVKLRQSYKTGWCTCFFYKHDVYKHIQAQVWWFFKHMLSIMLSLAK